MSTLRQDVIYSLRLLRKSPGHAILAMLVLALGIGANAAIFSTADALITRPLRLDRLEELVSVMETEPHQVGPWNELSPANFTDYHQRARSFAHFGVYGHREYNVAGSGSPDFLRGARVSEGFFPALNVAALHGRTFQPEEMRANGDLRVVLLSHGLWTRRYSGDPAVVGRTIRLDGESHTVVGVMPPSFTLPAGAELWTPLVLTPQAERTNFLLYGVALLKPGVTPGMAQAELSTLAKQLEREHPDTNTGRGVRVLPLRRFVTGPAREFMLLLLGAVAVVLVIACANVANLQLAQATGRQREIALRLALGASRGRILRQMLTEGVVLALGGAVLALLFAAWGIELIRSGMPPEVLRFVPGWSEMSLDHRTLLFAMAIALASGVLTALLPALRALRLNLQGTLREGRSSGTDGRRLRSLLVVAEVALTLVLLVGAGLMGKGFFSLMQTGEPRQPQGLLTFRISRPPVTGSGQEARYARFFDELQQRLQAMPGVVAVSGTTFLPYSQRNTDDPLTVEGDAPRPSSEIPVARTQSVLPDYFATLRIPLLAGRPITAADGPDAPRVAVISESLARQRFPGRDPIGRRLRVGSASRGGSWLTVVGIAADVTHDWFEKEPLPTLYRPETQAARRQVHYAVRVTGDPLALVPAVRTAVAALDPEQAIAEVLTLDRVIHHSFTALRYTAYLIGAASLLALVLACAGIFAVISTIVAERTHEIGIRMALGATAAHVQRAVLRQGLVLALAGVAVGMAGAAALARALSYFLFGVTAGDPWPYAAVSLLLVAVALLAGYVPARRATRVDPVLALRGE